MPVAGLIVGQYDWHTESGLWTCWEWACLAPRQIKMGPQAWLTSSPCDLVSSMTCSITCGQALHVYCMIDPECSWLQTHRVWALDLLGMGLSWPQTNRDGTASLAYSIDMWTEQLVGFMEEVVAEPAYVAGNSLGGLLAASLGAIRPDLCRSST